MHPLRHRPLFRLFAFLLAVLAVAPNPVLAASATPQPVKLPALAAAKPVLSITTAAGLRRFSLVELEALGLKEVSTKTFWPADLAVIYPLPKHWPVILILGAGLAVATWSVLFLWHVRRKPYVGNLSDIFPALSAVCQTYV